MAWSADFLSRLTKRQHGIVYVLEVIEVYQEPGLSYGIGSHGGTWPTQTKARIVRVDIAGPTVTPRAWTATIGAWNVTFTGDLKEVCSHITAGTIVELIIGFEGMALADFQRVAVGQVRDIRGTGPEYTLEVLGLDIACKRRLSTGYNLTNLFTGLGTTTTLSVPYTPGDATLVVGTTTNFERETGGTGAVMITPSTGGDPFYLTYTGTGGGPSFTGVSATGACGTTAVAAAAGDLVTEVAYLSGHPLDIARKILCSRDGTNGTYDVYPSDWGIGLLDELVDHDDIDLYKSDAVIVGSGSYIWEYIQTSAIDDAYAWLGGLLRSAGLVLTTRQGSLTIRAAQNSQSATVHSGITLTDADISAEGAGVALYEAFELRHSPEYMSCLVKSATTNSGAAPFGFGIEDAATLPAGLNFNYDLSNRVFQNELEQVWEVHHRVQESVYRRPERIGFRCAGYRLAQLACLDILDLTTKRVQSRRDGRDGFSGRRAVIENVTPRWGQASVDVSLFVYPEDGAQFA